MAERMKRPFTLLAAYEDFTRKETVALQDGAFERLLSLQRKKGRVVEELKLLDTELSEAELSDFSQRVSRLQQTEQANSDRLKEKLAANRQEFRQLTQNAISASKLRNAYAKPERGAARNTSLNGRA